MVVDISMITMLTPLPPSKNQVEVKIKNQWYWWLTIIIIMNYNTKPTRYIWEYPRCLKYTFEKKMEIIHPELHVL